MIQLNQMTFYIILLFNAIFGEKTLSSSYPIQHSFRSCQKYVEYFLSHFSLKLQDRKCTYIWKSYRRQMYFEMECLDLFWKAWWQMFWNYSKHWSNIYIQQQVFLKLFTVLYLKLTKPSGKNFSFIILFGWLARPFGMFWLGKVLGEFCVCYALPNATPHGGFRSGIPQGGGGWSIFYICDSYMFFLHYERAGQRIGRRCCLYSVNTHIAKKAGTLCLFLTLLLLGW